jgi:hypothetical protein
MADAGSTVDMDGWLSEQNSCVKDSGIIERKKHMLLYS